MTITKLRSHYRKCNCTCF